MRKHKAAIIINIFGGLLLLLAGFGQVKSALSSNHNSTVLTPSDTSKHTKDLAVELKVLNETQVKISVTNVSKNLVRAYSYVKTYEKHYDYFEIEAITPDHDKLFFVFYDNRDKSAPVIVELKLGESFSHTIDFLQWTERSINAETLKKAGLYHLPHGIKIRAKYHNTACDNCNDYYKSIWTGYVYSDWVDF